MTKPLDKQVGGNHYKDLVIQPVEYIFKNNIGYIEGCVIKYVTRWQNKGGVQDLEKAKHFLELLIELQNQKAKDGMLELVQEASDKMGSTEGLMRSEQFCVEDVDLSQYGHTKPDAIRNLLKEYKRVVVRYRESTSDKELQYIADILCDLPLDIVVESQRPNRLGVVVYYALREDRADG